MKTPTPPDAASVNRPSGDRRPTPASKPVHAVTFRPPRTDDQRPPDRSPTPLRGWVLVVGLVLLVAAGGWLLNHLQRHPVAPQTEPTDRQEPAAADPEAIADRPPAPTIEASQPSVPPPPVKPVAEKAEAKTTSIPVPVQESTVPDTTGNPAAEPQAAAGDDSSRTIPQTDPTRQRFEDLLSQGLAQLHRRQYHEARITLLKATAMDPGSTAVKEALTQADHALKLDQLDRLHKQATAAERNGQWSTALDRYVAALAIDPNVGFALRGKQHAIQRITIGRRIDFYLTQPETLLSDSHLENAIQLLAEAGRIDPRDADLATALEALDRQLTAAQTPVQVTLTSDNLTDVAVYRVGRLGRFEARELNLRPGTYTVVGTRDGFRDVRLTVRVPPGTTPATVRVVCTEAIDANAS